MDPAFAKAVRVGKTVKAQGRQAKTSLYFPLIHAPIAATTFGSSPI
ncbi:MAG: hypothetical protein JWL84_1636 [Rhodospirillales bacterium]|jgi:hypothetical protein|nr:hypothetical protein [Rhodospirillales bacterium]